MILTFPFSPLLTRQASLSMDEAARQTSSHSLSSASSYTSATMRRPGSSQRQHRRTGSVGTVSEHEVNKASMWPRAFGFGVDSFSRFITYSVSKCLSTSECLTQEFE